MNNKKENESLKPLALWQGHMRRGRNLRSEKEFTAALALVPALVDYKSHLIKTLRALADLYVEEGQLEEAEALFVRILSETEQPTRVFLCDYAKLLFSLAEQQLEISRVAMASDCLHKVEVIRKTLPEHMEMREICYQGYLRAGQYFEHIREFPAADLYYDRACSQSLDWDVWDDPLQIMQNLALYSVKRQDFVRGDYWGEKAVRFVRENSTQFNLKAGDSRARLAQLWEKLGLTAFGVHKKALAEKFFHKAEIFWKQMHPSGQAELAQLYMSWGFQRFAPNGRELFEKALVLRRSLFGEEHTKTVEARQAVEMQGTPLNASDHFEGGRDEINQDWDGNKAFLDSLISAQSSGNEKEDSLKQIHRRLVKMVHPDLARDEKSFKILNELMIEVNAAATAENIYHLKQLELKVRLETARHQRNRLNQESK